MEDQAGESTRRWVRAGRLSGRGDRLKIRHPEALDSGFRPNDVAYQIVSGFIP